MTALRQAAASLRADVLRSLPESASLRIDRTGSALYAVFGDPPIRIADGWLCQKRGSAHLLTPGIPQLQMLRSHTPPHPLTASFASRPSDPEILPLFAALLRATEMPPAPSVQQKLDRQLRQAMAVALRTGSGGGLEVCHALFSLIQ